MFLHGWAIAIGAAALGLPVLIHWLTRPRPVRMPISTLKFLQESIRQRRARNRLRDVLVLTCRTAAIALLAAAVARPLIGRATPGAASDSADVVRVVLLDVSQSMAATSQGVENFERVRPRVARELEYRPGLKADLILAGARPAAVSDSPSTNFGLFQEALATADVRPERFDVQATLNLAAEVFARAPESQARRELVVFSDFQRTNWAVADLSVVPAAAIVRLESAAPPEPPANLALLSISAAGRIEAGREALLSVDVGNYSATPRQVEVEIELGDTVSRAAGLCAPRTRTKLAAPIQVPNTGWRTGAARLVSVQDALQADNTRYYALQARLRPVYSLLTRERPDTRAAASYFVERALAALAGDAGGPATIERIDAEQPDADALERADALVIVQPGRLSKDVLQQLQTFVRRGRGVLYVAAEAADAVNLQQIAAMNPELSFPVDFQPPQHDAERADLFLTDIAPNRAMFAVFGDQAAEATGALRFAGGLVTRRRPNALADDVLATFNDQSAFLVMTSSGGGRLAVLNADLARSDLPRSPVFVPMLSELLQKELLTAGESTLTFPCGEPVTAVLLPASESVDTLQLVAPAGAPQAAGRLSQEGGSLVWHIDAAGPPGVYEVRRGADLLAAAVTALPEEESDLSAVSEDVLRDRLSGGRTIEYRGGGQAQQDEQESLWTWLLLGCVLCALGELVILRVFRT